MRKQECRGRAFEAWKEWGNYPHYLERGQLLLGDQAAYAIVGSGNSLRVSHFDGGTQK